MEEPYPKNQTGKGARLHQIRNPSGTVESDHAVDQEIQPPLHSFIKANVYEWQISKINVYLYVRYEANASPVKPGSLYHDEPVHIPKGNSTCVICGKRTRWMCFGCCKDLGDIYPVCPASARECQEQLQLHNARNEIYLRVGKKMTSVFFQKNSLRGGGSDLRLKIPDLSF